MPEVGFVKDVYIGSVLKLYFGVLWFSSFWQPYIISSIFKPFVSQIIYFWKVSTFPVLRSFIHSISWKVKIMLKI